MTSTVIVDTGPLVALFNRGDRWHAWAAGQFDEIEAPIRTCEAVIVEAAHLLRRDGRGPDALLQLVSRGLLAVEFQLQSQAEETRRLMWKYRDVPMSVADACLVRMTERQTRVRVMTLDADFRRYRRNGRQVIPLLAPDA